MRINIDPAIQVSKQHYSPDPSQADLSFALFLQLEQAMPAATEGYNVNLHLTTDSELESEDVDILQLTRSLHGICTLEQDNRRLLTPLVLRLFASPGAPATPSPDRATHRLSADLPGLFDVRSPAAIRCSSFGSCFSAWRAGQARG